MLFRSVTGTKSKVKWYTSDRSIATVNQKGIVRGIGAGSCRVYAKVNGGTFLCMIHVGNATVQQPNLTIIPTPQPPSEDKFNENDAKNNIQYVSHCRVDKPLTGLTPLRIRTCGFPASGSL